MTALLTATERHKLVIRKKALDLKIFGGTAKRADVLTALDIKRRLTADEDATFRHAGYASSRAIGVET